MAVSPSSSEPTHRLYFYFPRSRWAHLDAIPCITPTDSCKTTDLLHQQFQCRQQRELGGLAKYVFLISSCLPSNTPLSFRNCFVSRSLEANWRGLIPWLRAQSVAIIHSHRPISYNMKSLRPLPPSRQCYKDVMTASPSSKAPTPTDGFW